MRLDKKYSQVRSNMLMTTDLPTSAQAYRILLLEETHLELSTSEINDLWLARLKRGKKELREGLLENPQRLRSRSSIVSIVKYLDTPRTGAGR